MPHSDRAILLVLSGPLCAGKTTLARSLAEHIGGEIVSARAELRRLGARADRQDLQRFGTELEARTDGYWLADVAVPQIDDGRPIVVDSARTSKQIQAFRVMAPQAVVIYLSARIGERRRRFDRRLDSVDRGRSFEAVMETEDAEVEYLGSVADICLDTSDMTPSDIAAIAIAHVEGHPEG